MIEITRRQIGNARGELEAFGVSELEGRREIEFCGLLLDGRYNLVPAMACIAAPQTCCAIENLAAVGGGVIHILGTCDHARAFLEGAVRRKRHPPGFKIVGGQCGLGRIRTSGSHRMLLQGQNGFLYNLHHSRTVETTHIHEPACSGRCRAGQKRAEWG